MIPADLVDLAIRNVRLLAPNEVANEVVGGRVVARLEISPSRELVVARLVLRGPEPRGTKIIETSRALLVHLGTMQPATFAIRSRWLGDVIRALAAVHVEDQRARRDRDRSFLFAVDLPRELVDVGSDAGVDAQTLVTAASRAFLALDIDAQSRLLEDARATRTA